MSDIPATTPTQPVSTPERDSGRFVVFTVSGERWALPVEVVSEVQQIAALTALPEPDGALIGYLDLRGDVVGVVDGRILLGKEPVRLDVDMHLIVVTDGTARAALVVDEVLGVADAVVPQGASAPGLAATPMGALVRDAEGLIPLPDVTALIAAGRGSAAS
jgi:purine-binding chemotaxis protein CheW